MKISEIVRLIKKHGCIIKRHGAEHDIWINPTTGGEASVPRHSSKELPTGTAEKNLKGLKLK